MECKKEGLVISHMGTISDEEFFYTKLWHYMRSRLLGEEASVQNIVTIHIGAFREFVQGEYYCRSDDEKLVVHILVIGDVAVFYFDAGEGDSIIAHKIFSMIRRCKKEELKNEAS